MYIVLTPRNTLLLTFNYNNSLRRALVKPVTVNIRDGQNLTAITKESRICHVAATDFNMKIVSSCNGL